MAQPDEPEPPRSRRARSARYPGAPLAEGVELARFVAEKGLDGLSAAAIASALGYTNVKTNTFSARLSAARQFGLLELAGDGYALTALGRAILEAIDPAERMALYRRALLEPPLYADLAERLAGKRVPEASILADVLHHHHQITEAAKRAAAEAFLESARFAGALGDDQVFRPHGPGTASPQPIPAAGEKLATPASVSPPPTSAPAPRPRSADVRFDLRLWDRDRGKVIRVRAPESITPASLERFLQAFRLHVRVEEPPEAAGQPPGGDGTGTGR